MHARIAVFSLLAAAALTHSLLAEDARSTIFVYRNTDGADGGFATIVGAMERTDAPFYATQSSPNGIIGREDVVLLKTNSQWDQRGGTNTDLLKSVVLAITAHPEGFVGEIVVADNGQAQYGSHGRGGSMDWENNNALDRSQSVMRVVEAVRGSCRISAVLWDPITKTRVREYAEGDYADGFVVEDRKAATGAQVSYPKFTTEYGTHVSFKEGIWTRDGERYLRDKLKIINMPVLKSHSIYQVTAAIKNYMGVVSDYLTGHDAHNSVGRGFMGTQMAETRVPALNVLDAIWINPGRGPRTSYQQATNTGIIAVSADPCALDFWGAKTVLMPAAREHANWMARVMDPDAEEPGTFGYWLRLSLAELTEAGHPFTIDESNIEVVETN
jgi:hypothetical protein